MIKIFTRNDLYRVIGILLVVAGQFFEKSIFEGIGVRVETNVIQISGLVFILLPFLLKYISSKKENSTGNPPPSGVQ